jgi:hypothetical protein
MRKKTIGLIVLITAFFTSITVIFILNAIKIKNHFINPTFRTF